MANNLVNYDAAWAEEAERYASKEPVGTASSWISTRGGQLSYGDYVMPGNQMAVVVLDSVKEHAWFPDRFNPGDIKPPACFAFGEPDEATAPHETVFAGGAHFEAQADACAGCPKNEWGSADTGRGKACKEVRRLALLQAGAFEKRPKTRGEYDLELFASPKHFKQAPIGLLKLPVTSVREWAKFVQSITAATHRPPHGVIAHIWLEPDPDTQFKFAFELVEPLDGSLYPVIQARREEARRLLTDPYSPPKPRNEKLQGRAVGGRR